jgi:hypothetical protein
VTRRPLTLLGAVLVALAAGVTALAYFTSFGTGSGQATVGRLNPPTNVAATSSAGSGTVSLSWTAAATGVGAVAAQGYYVTRIKNSDSSTSAACSSGPSSLITATSCADNGVGNGTYHYTVTAVYHTWTATSAASNNVTVVNDNAAPAASISFPGSGTSYNASTFNAGCSPTGVCGTAADPSGVQSVKVSIRRNSDGAFWNGAAFSGSTESFNTASLGTPNGTSTSWNYPFTLPADGSYTVHVQATDTVGNAQSGTNYAATATFTIDTAAPTASITFPPDSSSDGALAYNNGCFPAGICGTAADASGVQSVKVSIRRNSDGSYWNGSAFGGSTETFNTASLGTPNGTSTSWDYAFGLPADGSYTVHVQATDAAGNAQSGTTYAATTTFTIDTTAPAATVTATSASPASSQPLSYTVVFSEPVSDLSAAGVQLGGTANETSATVSVSKTDSQHFTVSVGGLKTDGTGDGTVSVQVKASAVSDAAGNGNTASNTASVAWDRTAPTVTAINRHSGTPTNASSVQWDVSFSESVTGVTAANFSLVNGGLSGPAITSVSGSGSTWTVTASTGSGSGTLGLNQSSGSGVTDAAGNTLSGSFTGQAYTIDRTAPAVSVTQVNGVGRTFPYATNAANVSSIGGGCGNAGGDLASVSWSFDGQSGTASCGSGSWTATLTPAVAAEGSYTAQASQSDSAGNTGSDSKGVILDRTAPTNALSLVSQSTQPGPSTSSNAASFLSGSTLWYAGGSSGSAKLQNAVTDSLSGPASSTFGSLGGTTTGWTFTGSTVSAPSGGPYVSNQLGWGSGSTSSPTEAVTGADAAGNSAPTTLTLRNDSTPPTDTISFPASGGSYTNAAWNGSTCAGAICGAAADPGTNGNNAPSFGSATSAQNGSGGSLTINKPASTATGDVLVAAVSVSNNATITPPTGWTPILASSNGNNVNIASYYHVVTNAASEPASYSWGFSSSPTTSGGIARYTGVDTSNPIDVSGVATGNSTQPVAPSVTTTAANDLVVGLFASQANTSFTAPTGMAERYDVPNASGPSTEASDVAQANAGATGTKTATTGTSGKWAAELVALNAAPPNISGLAKVQVSVQATSGANSGKYWDPSTGGFTSSSELLLTSSGTSSWSLAFPASNFSDGTYTVKAYGVDNVGNFGTASVTGVAIDNVAPTSSSALSPTPNGAGWEKAATTVTLSATDTVSGVKSITYSATGAQPISSTTINGSSTTINISTQGTTTVSFHAADNAGNVETPENTVTVKLDTTAPTNALSLVNQSGGTSLLSGSTVYYKGSVAGQFQLQNTLSDALSGPASSSFAALGGTATGWSFTGSTVSTPSGGPYVSNTFSWSGGTTTSPTEAVTGTDVAGITNTAATLTFTNDSTAPSTSASLSPAANGAGWNNTAPVQVTLTATDAGSGVSQTKYTTDGSDPATSNTATVYAGPFNISSTTTVKFLSVDRLGNEESTQTKQVNIDTQAPTVTAAIANTITNTAGFLKSGGTYYVYANATDAGSGVNASTVTADVHTITSNGNPGCKDLSGGNVNCTAVPLSSTGGPFTVKNADGTTTQYAYRSFQQTAQTLSAGSLTFSVTAQDIAGNSGSSSGASVTVDNTAPSAPTAVALANGGGSSGNFINIANKSSVSVRVTLPASSLASDTVTVTLSDGAHTTTAATTAASAGAGTVTVTGIDASALNEGTNNITISATSTDAAGNASGAKTGTASKDTVAPAAPSGLSYTDNTSPTADVLSGSAEANSSITITESGATSGTFTGSASAGGTFSINVAAVTGNGPGKSVSFSVTATDAAGNTGPAGALNNVLDHG